jgi:hypothetical protein
MGDAPEHKRFVYRPRPPDYLLRQYGPSFLLVCKAGEGDPEPLFVSQRGLNPASDSLS